VGGFLRETFGVRFGDAEGAAVLRQRIDEDEEAMLRLCVDEGTWGLLVCLSDIAGARLGLEGGDTSDAEVEAVGCCCCSL